jgi:acetamidase/formamidase
LPDSHNCADFGQYLIGAPHRFGLTKEELHAAKTDGHMDTNSVREGAILICPVKVPGAGVYMGDMHAQQGNGEIAGHATDVSGETELTVEVIKGLTLDGPILLQNVDDLPPMARPMTSNGRRWRNSVRAGASMKWRGTVRLPSSAVASTSTKPPRTACTAPQP